MRQFLYGQRFFEREFGRRAEVFWNPDVFGYNGQLPQLMRGAGISGFLTQKLSWNRYTAPEHHTFRWVGIDGSSVIAHFPPADTYNAEATVPELRRAARDFKDHERSARSRCSCSAGATAAAGRRREMLETLARVADLQGVPRTTIGDPEAFFGELADESEWPEVVGELYLEYHRGTYTTQARTKRASRRAERALHDAELLAAVAGEPAGLELTRVADAPAQPLPRHPAGVVDRRGARAGGARPGRGRGGGRARCGTGCVARDGREHRRRRAPRGGRRALAVRRGAAVRDRAVRRAARGGDASMRTARPSRSTTGSSARSSAATARCARSSLGGREAMAAPGNVLELYDDRPTDFEAWDLDPFHLETRADCPPARRRAEVVLADPLRAEVAFERPIGERSRMRQTVRLDAEARRLEFHCAIDWQEDRRALKVRFPVAVLAPRATYEMQFGVVERPTHFSTRRDAAQYEVPGHRFADLSEHGFGVALLSAATYGWSTLGGEMRMTLLRSPRWPDPDADRGAHELAFAVFPHAGGWQDAGVTARGAALQRAAAARLRGDAEPRSWFACDELMVDTVKPAEDGDGLIVRLYEAHGGRGVARLRVGVPFGEAWFANLLEDRLGPAQVDGDEIVIPFRPFEIVTVALSRPPLGTKVPGLAPS